MASTAAVEPYPRDIIVPRLLPPSTATDTTGDSYIKIVTWNVAGLRGILKANPKVLEELVNKVDPDVLCLQETKLQTSHVTTDGYENLLTGYNSYWTCSETKKGYAGNAVFIKKTIKVVQGVDNSSSSSIGASSVIDSKPKSKAKPKATLMDSWVKKAPASSSSEAEETVSTTADATSPIVVQSVKYELENNPKLCGEGRTITVEFDKFYLVACYVPNSGQTLERLDFRVDEWDPYMRDYLAQLRQRKPVVFTGDLNVGHLDLDIYNPLAKHIVKQAGLTPRERHSMTTTIELGMLDALRVFYPGNINSTTNNK